MLKSWSMLVIMSYITQQEQLETQLICIWFYKYGTSRVQTRIRLGFHLFTYPYTRVIESSIISVNYSGTVVQLTCVDDKISHMYWISVQVKHNQIF